MDEILKLKRHITRKIELETIFGISLILANLENIILIGNKNMEQKK